MYRVTEKCQDGWFKGTSLRTAASGVFPGNYVTPVSRLVSSGLGMGRVEGIVVIQLPEERHPSVQIKAYSSHGDEAWRTVLPKMEKWLTSCQSVLLQLNYCLPSAIVTQLYFLHWSQWNLKHSRLFQPSLYLSFSSFGLVMRTRRCNTITKRPLIFSAHKGGVSADTAVVIYIVIFHGNFLAPTESEYRSGRAVQFWSLLWHVIALVFPCTQSASCHKGKPNKQFFGLELAEVQSADTVFLVLMMCSSCVSVHSTLWHALSGFCFHFLWLPKPPKCFGHTGECTRRIFWEVKGL